MKVANIAVAALLVCQIMPVSSASAQRMTDDEREAAYQSCVSEYQRRNMGNEGQATNYCYAKYYPHDVPGGPPRSECGPNAFNCFG